MVSRLGLPQYARTTDLESFERSRGSLDMAIPAPPTATTSIPQNPQFHARIQAERVPVNIWTPVCPPRPNRLPIPLPPQLDGVDTVSLNPALRAGGAASGVDLEALPGEVFHVHNDDEKGRWSEPATVPGLPSLTLLAPGLPWVVVAHASRGEVSVGDVLLALYGSLNMPVDVGELEVGVGERLHQQGGKGRGKRIAFLEGRTRFAGLRPYQSQEGCDTWVVDFV
ncbi:hypothetical protein C8F01DRAFT_1174914 [Mycena amicta]|nr:hypothetical protein C8F01DRAFT_1174914 [Mycena amicta]